MRAVLDSIFASPAYRWVDAPTPFRRLAEWWHWLVDLITSVRGNHPVLFRVAALVLAAWGAWLLLHGAWATLRSAQTAPSDPADAVRGPERPRSPAWYLRAADDAAATGKFADALQLAFHALALRLDAAEIVRYQVSKTPSEYAHEARLDAAERDRLRSLVGVLYNVAFGGRPYGLEDYRSWRAAAEAEWHAPAH